MCQIKPVALIVEDRPEVALIWQKYLQPLEMEIRVALTLADAKIQSKVLPPPDLILLDLRLTDSKDTETLASIRELTAANPACAVLILSGYVTPEITEIAIREGAHQVMSKLAVDRAADLWGFMKNYLSKASPSVQKRMAHTSELIETLSSKLPLL